MKKEDIKRLIAEGYVEKALDQLTKEINLIEDESIQNDFILQSSRLKRIFRDKNLGVTNNENANIAINQITIGVLSLIDEVFVEVNKLKGKSTYTHFSDGELISLPVTKPGLFRHLLDRYFPRLHSFLTKAGVLPYPHELSDLNTYLRNLQSVIENDVKGKTYLPLEAKQIEQSSIIDQITSDIFFVHPIQQVIKSITGQSIGGDSSSAQIAVLSRKSHRVKNILKILLKAKEPLVLLGDPGTGKTMTLQETAYSLAKDEINRVFPKVILFIRLGEFRIENEQIGKKEVIDYIKKSTMPEIKPYIDSLLRSERLIILFDGLDEMSRDRYNESTEALSLFAGANKGLIKTLFTCRITDFSSKFVHKRLVLLPLNRNQIYQYLKNYIHSPTLFIDGKEWTVKKLASRLSQGNLPVEANNPFVLWLLIFYLIEKSTWPRSRVELLYFYNEKNYERKKEDYFKDKFVFPEIIDAFQAWSRIAYIVTLLNEGTSIQVNKIEDWFGFKIQSLSTYIEIGERCGIIQKSKKDEQLIRFQHHRFQEFFAAYFIYHEKPEIEWLKKMDSPRWQETMLNLILMGDEPIATEALIEALETPTHNYKHYGFGTDGHETSMSKWQSEEEILIADRVELGTRIIRQSDVNNISIRKKLMPSLETTITFLLKNGNPVTQVKMINACINIPDFDALEALEKPLQSPVQWVKNQALTLLENPNRKIASNVALEIANDFKNGIFFHRLNLYWKLIRKNNKYWQWWIFCWAFIIGVIELLVLLSFSAALILITDDEAGFGNDSIWHIMPICLIAVIGSLIWAVKYDPKHKFTITNSVGLLSYMLISSLLYEKITIGFLIFLLAVMTLATTLLFVFNLILNFVYLLFFWLVNYRLVRKGDVLDALKENSFPNSKALTQSIGCGCSSSLVIGAMLIIVALENPITYLSTHIIGFIYRHFHLEYLPFNPVVNFILFALLVGGSIIMSSFLIRFLLKRKSSYPWDPFLYLFLLVPLFGILILLHESYKKNILKITPEYEHANIQNPFVSKLIFGALLLAVAVLSLALASFLIREAKNTFLRKIHPYPPGAYTREKWVDLLSKSDAQKQKEILIRTSHQSISLNLKQFVELLVEIEKEIKEEPALSIYWEKRYRLEAILKQENVG